MEEFLNVHSYDRVLVAFSGGKDSTALYLHLRELGVPNEKIELHHNLIDGEAGTFMDWECTDAYCQAFADAFGVPIYFSYREGGFEREMLRENALTAPTWFQDQDHVWHKAGGLRGNKSTRRKFPQVSGNLSIRWCSSSLKIDVFAMCIRNQERFNNSRTLVLSGERGEESVQRSKYAVLEPDRADRRDGKLNRHVDRWRPIRDWKEQQVWEIIERWKVRAHPAYYLGFGRVSCRYCIFGNANQMASAYLISPQPGDKMAAYEDEFGLTIKRNISLRDLINKGTPYQMDEQTMELSRSTGYNLSIFMEDWILPQGAYGESCGPT